MLSIKNFNRLVESTRSTMAIHQYENSPNKKFFSIPFQPLSNFQIRIEFNVKFTVRALSALNRPLQFRLSVSLQSANGRRAVCDLQMLCNRTRRKITKLLTEDNLHLAILILHYPVSLRSLRSPVLVTLVTPYVTPLHVNAPTPHVSNAPYSKTKNAHRVYHVYLHSRAFFVRQADMHLKCS